MLTILRTPKLSQRQTACNVIGNALTSKLDTLQPLTDFFLAALEENKRFRSARQHTHPFTSPIFKVVQLLKAHPALKELSAEQAWERLDETVKPNWQTLFPEAEVPSLEFITAWNQVKMPGNVPFWQRIEVCTINKPLKLAKASVVEGYERYLGIAFHCQKLRNDKDILLPVKEVSVLLTKQMEKPISEQLVSYYSGKARNDGYLKLVAKAHHPSGKAARYRFDLSRFTDAGVEKMIDPSLDEQASSGFSHGSQGTQGSEGSQGSEDNDKTSVFDAGISENTNQTQQEEKEDNKEKKISKDIVISSNEAGKNLSLVEFAAARLRDVIGGWQKPLTAKERGQLKNLANVLGARTRDVIDYAFSNWWKFAEEAKGDAGLKSFPTTPQIWFLLQHCQVAVNQLEAKEAELVESEEPIDQFVKIPHPVQVQVVKEKPFTATPAQVAKIMAAETDEELDAVFAEIDAEKAKDSHGGEMVVQSSANAEIKTQHAVAQLVAVSPKEKPYKPTMQDLEEALRDD